MTEVARQHGLRVVKMENWQDQHLRTAENGLQRQPKDEEDLKDEEIKKLQQKIVEFLMEMA